mgnify:CR=1 FL=1
MKIIKFCYILPLIFLAALGSFNHQAKAESYDLKADSLVMNSAKCEVNQLCSFTVRVKNLGSDFTLNFPLKSAAVGDGFKDRDELAGGFSPTVKNKKINYDQAPAGRQKGKILLQVESRGQAWYVNPADGRRNFLSRPADAFNVMRRLGVGVANSDYAALGGK